MAAQKAVEFLSGKLYWAKIVGDPRPNYGGDAREWAFEFEPNEEGLAILKKHKLTDRLKDKYDDRGKFITLKKSEFNRDGEPNKPIRIYDSEDNEWEEGKLIGNASDADVKLDIRDYGVGKKKGVYPVAVRVTKLVSFQSSEFGGMNKPAEVAENDDMEAAPAPKVKSKAPAKPKFDVPNDELLDDEVPF